MGGRVLKSHTGDASRRVDGCLESFEMAPPFSRMMRLKRTCSYEWSLNESHIPCESRRQARTQACSELDEARKDSELHRQRRLAARSELLSVVKALEHCRETEKASETCSRETAPFSQTDREFKRFGCLGRGVCVGRGCLGGEGVRRRAFWKAIYGDP